MTTSTQKRALARVAAGASLAAIALGVVAGCGHDDKQAPPPLPR